MITYVYWAVIIIVALGLFSILARMDHWKLAGTALVSILLAGWGSYYFYLEKVFVKEYGGVMSIPVPEGQYNMGITWKNNNLWIENYKPADNSCIFHEYSKGGIWQGEVVLVNCNPLFPPTLPEKRDDIAEP